jgi:5-methylcytosine-specific restriction protein B
VIDEINRGNISAIFGELLYALDRDKTINITLGNSGESYPIFIPDNLHIIGTMNTADRSIALVDFAIRRRFLFVEMQPDYELIDQLSTFNNQLMLGDFLQKLNKKITEYFNTDDYQIGHSYLIKSASKNRKPYDWSSDDLYEIIQYKIIPMLVEYAHGDKSIIANILGKNLSSASPDTLDKLIKEYINDDLEN